MPTNRDRFMKAVVAATLLVACKSREPAKQPPAAKPPADASAAFDVASLPEWPAAQAGSGDAVDVLAVDSEARPLLVELAPTNMVLVGGDKRVTGRIHAPRAAAFAAVATAASLDVTEQGTMHYVVPHGTAVPAPPKVASRDVFDLDTDDATVAQATIALGKLGFPLGACSDKRITVTLHGAPASEVARAIQVLSGEPLTEKPSCEATAVDPDTFDTRQRLRVVALEGKRHAAVFELEGKNGVVTDATKGIRWLADGLIFENGTTRVVHVETPGILDFTDWLKSLRRVSALVHAGDHWRAWFETDERTVALESNQAAWGMPAGMVPAFSNEGVRFDGTLVRLEPR